MYSFRLKMPACVNLELFGPDVMGEASLQAGPGLELPYLQYLADHDARSLPGVPLRCTCKCKCNLCDQKAGRDADFNKRYPRSLRRISASSASLSRLLLQGRRGNHAGPALLIWVLAFGSGGKDSTICYLMGDRRGKGLTNASETIEKCGVCLSG